MSRTYGAYFLIPLVGLALAAYFVDSGVLATILDVLPFSQAGRLLGDGLAPDPQLVVRPVAWLVIGAWTAAGFAVLARIAARREL